MMRVAFRCDAGFALGTGHVMRCLTLASQLREQGANVTFVCRRHDGHLGELIAARGFALELLPAPKAGLTLDGPPDHAAWLGAPWRDDARETLEALDRLTETSGVDWLIVDHYGIDARWERLLAPNVGAVMAIDDLADRKHECALLLDQNMIAGQDARYDGAVPPSCRRLLGPHYALLQPVYAELHAQLKPRSGPAKTILIFFGGADNDNLTGLALDAVLNLQAPDVTVDVDVVVAANGKHTGAVRAQLAGRDNVRIHSGLPTLAPLMAQADLAIGAGGATTWERICLGLPSLVVTLADNQVPVAAELAARGLIQWLGSKETVTAAALAAALQPYLAHGAPAGSADALADLVDGLGCARVAQAILTQAGTDLAGAAA